MKREVLRACKLSLSLVLSMILLSSAALAETMQMHPGHSIDSKILKEFKNLPRVLREQDGSNQGLPFLPGNNVTLLKGYLVYFCVEGGFKAGQQLVFSDGQREYRKAIAGDTAVVKMSADEVNMQPGKIYTWQVVGGSEKQGVVRLLANDQAEPIKQKMKQLAAGEGTELEKTIKIALYLQLISDEKLGQIDLYWLSYQYVYNLDLEQADEAAKANVQEIKARYVRHLDNTGKT